MATDRGQPDVRIGQPRSLPYFLSRLYVEITKNCDSRCILCDYWKHRTPEYMTHATLASHVLSILKHYAPLDNVTITGGEPTLHANLVDFCRLIRQYANSLTLTTSTSCLRLHFQLLRPYVTSYLLSLDSANPITYKKSRGIDLADYVLNWIRTIRYESDARVAVNCVIQASNYDQIYETVSACADRGAHHVFMTAVSAATEAYGRTGRVPKTSSNASNLTPTQVDQVAKQLARLCDDFSDDFLPTKPLFPYILSLLSQQPAWENYSCDVPWTSAVISADAHVLPCFYMPFRAPPDPLSVRSLVQSVQDSMVSDPEFRATYCDRCPCFITRRIPLSDLQAIHAAYPSQALINKDGLLWGYTEQNSII